MDPMACKYPQGSDGIVYAEFDMLLYSDSLWYRDRQCHKFCVIRAG